MGRQLAYRSGKCRPYTGEAKSGTAPHTSKRPSKPYYLLSAGPPAESGSNAPFTLPAPRAPVSAGRDHLPALTFLSLHKFFFDITSTKRYPHFPPIFPQNMWNIAFSFFFSGFISAFFQVTPFSLLSVRLHNSFFSPLRCHKLPPAGTVCVLPGAYLYSAGPVRSRTCLASACTIS